MSLEISVQFCFVYENVHRCHIVSTFTRQITSLYHESVYHISPIHLQGKRAMHETANFHTCKEEAQKVARLVQGILGDADVCEEVEGGKIYKWHGKPYGYLMVCEVYK